MFIFARCRRSSAAVTPAKYELDIIQVTTVLIIRKNWENNGTEKIGLVTPTPVPVQQSWEIWLLAEPMLIYFQLYFLLK